jgi:molecular chaperone HtpG
MQSMFQYMQKHFKSVTKGDFSDKEQEDAIKNAQEQYAKTVEFLQKELANEVSEVKFSCRLADSPCCLITDGAALPPHMERLFRAMNQEVPVSKRILELNCDHPLIKAFESKLASGGDDAVLGKYARVLYNQALMLEGSPVSDPAEFARSIQELLAGALEK